MESEEAEARGRRSPGKSRLLLLLLDTRLGVLSFFTLVLRAESTLSSALLVLLVFGNQFRCWRPLSTLEGADEVDGGRPFDDEGEE